MADPVVRVLSLGAGVQSTTLALMSSIGALPKVDAAIFADTGWEPQAVYRHLAWLESVLTFPVLRVKNGDIRESILARRNTSGGRFASVPWHIRNPDGSAAMGRRQCSSEFKLTPIMWKVRELLRAGRRDRLSRGAAEVWIGITTDEASRMKPARQRYMTNRWPLIELDMSRQDCLAWLAGRRYPEPPKSSCIGCPFHNDAMWQQIKHDTPDEFADAVAVDAALRQGNARGVKGDEYMHPLRVPLDLALSDDPTVRARLRDERLQNLNLFENECEGICGV